MADKIAKRGVSIYIDGKEVKNSVADITGEMKKLQREQRKMTIGSDEYVAHARKIGQLKAMQQEHIAYTRKIADEYDKTSKSATGFFNKITGGFGKLGVGIAIGAAVAAGIRSWINEMIRFSSAVSELSAITGATGKDLDFLKNKAKSLGAQYGKSATEIVEAMKLVGSAKPELLENAAALSDMTESVLVLSKASGMELSNTTQSLATIMNQFGLSAAEANRVINTLAAGSKYGAVEVDYLGDAISKVGAVAASAGLNLEQTVAVMELFGEKGIKAEIAGTGFKAILVELQSDTKNYTNGVFDLNKAIDNNQRIAGDNIALTKKFGKEYFNLAQILLQNKERFVQLNGQVAGTSVAFEQYAIATDNLRGDIDKMTASWTSFILSLEDGKGPIANVFRGLTQFINEALGGMALLAKNESQRNSSSTQKIVGTRIGDIKTELTNQKDKVHYINQEIIAEKNLYKQKAERIEQLKNEIKEEKEKNYFLRSDSLIIANENEIKGLEKAKNTSIAYINALGGLRKDVTGSVVPSADIVDTNTPTTPEEEAKATVKAISVKEKIKAENARISKEMADAAIVDLEDTLAYSDFVSREQLAGVKQTLDQEHALKLKQLGEDKQLELNKADLSLQSAEDIGKQKKLIEQKYRTLTAEEDAKFAAETANVEKQQQLKVLSDKLASAAQGSQEAFDLEKQMREIAMDEELALVEKGSAAAQAIREKYRKMDEDAENTLLKTKQEMVFDYANAGMNVFNGLNNFIGALGERELANFKKQNKDKANFDEQYAAKKAELERKAAERAKLLAAFDIIINTAAAVVEALPNIPLSIAAGVAGGIQLATVLAAPLPEYFTGGFTGSGGKYEPKGVVHGNEFVANSDALANPNLMPVFNAIDQAQRMGTVRNLKPKDFKRALGQENTSAVSGVRQRPSDSGNAQVPVSTLTALNDALLKVHATNSALVSELEKGIEAKYKISGDDGVVKGIEKYNKLIKIGQR